MNRASWFIREGFALSVWLYAIMKLLVLDVDLYLLKKIAPNLAWALDYKAFGLVAILGILTLLVRNAGIGQRI